MTELVSHDHAQQSLSRHHVVLAITLLVRRASAIAIIRGILELMKKFSMKNEGVFFKRLLF
jgi:hypothetical protein